MGRFTRNWDNILTAIYAKKPYTAEKRTNSITMPTGYNKYSFNQPAYTEYKTPSYEVDQPLYVKTFADELLPICKGRGSYGAEYGIMPYFTTGSPFSLLEAVCLNQGVEAISTHPESDNCYFRSYTMSKWYRCSYPIGASVPYTDRGIVYNTQSPQIKQRYSENYQYTNNIGGCPLGIALGSGSLQNSDIYDAANLAAPLKFTWGSGDSKTKPAINTKIAVNTAPGSSQTSGYDSTKNSFRKLVTYTIQNISSVPISFSEIGIFAPVASHRGPITSGAGTYTPYAFTLAREDADPTATPEWIAHDLTNNETQGGTQPFGCYAMIWYDKFDTKTLAPGDYIQIRVDQEMPILQAGEG